MELLLLLSKHAIVRDQIIHRNMYLHVRLKTFQRLLMDMLVNDMQPNASKPNLTYSYTGGVPVRSKAGTDILIHIRKRSATQ